MTETHIQSSFNSGEWAPQLYARVDLQKYRSGAALLQNFFVDYRGGASTRTGTQFITAAYDSTHPVRLIRFSAGYNTGYILEFGQNYIRPIANGAVIPATIISTPWAGADLQLLKYSQTGNTMIFTHPNYVPYVLTYTNSTTWTLAPIPIGPTISAPASSTTSTTLPTFVYDPYPTNPVFGYTYYSYCVTAVSSTGQESVASPVSGVGPRADMRVFPSYGTNQITWPAVSGAVYYKIYSANLSTYGIQPPTVQFGYIGYSTGLSFVDGNIAPDFSQGVPVSQNPFPASGNGVANVAVTAAGTYTTVPTVTFGGSPTVAATAYATLGAKPTPTITAAGTGYAVGDLVSFGNGLTMVVLTLSGSTIASWAILSPGQILSGSTPTNPISQTSTTGGGTGATATVTWGVSQVIVTTPGTGYSGVPSVIFSSGAATGTAYLTAATNGNPAVCAFFQQRLVLAAPSLSPQTFYMSQPGDYYNFNTHQPVIASDAITGTLVSNQPNSIKSIVSVPAGMLIFTDQAAWVVNGGGSFQGVSAAVSPENVVATAQSFIGANDMPPIISNYDILFVQSKGNQVRDLAYNIYFNVFTGTDISLISSHLFFGHNLTQWCWAEAPFFNVWAVRDDGILLCLTFLKEQEFQGWTHHNTPNGTFTSVASVPETTAYAGTVDAVYVAVTRVINGSSVQYIERFADRQFSNGTISAWCVDSGQQYTGAPTLSFSGASHLAGQIVTGLAQDDLNNVTVITPFTMPLSGAFTLPAPGGGATGYTTVTIGLGFTCNLQTLPLEVGEPTIQGKTKTISSVVVRVADTLGLSIGSSSSTLTLMRDLIVGNVSSMLTGQPSQIVTGLVSGDAKTYLDPTYTVPGQYYIQQSLPYPATVLGVFPQFTSADRER
jgi:hypothetical protein